MIQFQCLNRSCNFEQYYDENSDPSVCPECDGKCYRLTFCKDEVRTNKGVNWYEKDNPRWSTSMGVPAGQVKQFSKRFPNSTYSPDGRLLIKNRADKKRQMKERFMYEQD